MLGAPVRHSLSPVLHRAAYAELGLAGWRYDAIECDGAALPGFVAGLGPEWAGLSVTMPGKRAALAVAVTATRAATVVGAANTLVQVEPGRWAADCTDVAGVAGALRSAGFTGGGRGVVVGAGGTAGAAIAGLAELGVGELVLVARSAARAGAALACAEQVGVSVRVAPFDTGGLAEVCARSDVVVCTVPAGVADPAAAAIATCPVVLDVVYHPWPTELAAAVTASGGRLATGLDMLLHQAFGQVEQFTGRPAPTRVMHDALAAAVPDGSALGPLRSA